MDKDNHARNTAVQRRFDGCIALTPLYDFAPMYMHPDGIARRIRWEGNDGGSPDWGRVIDVVAVDCHLDRAMLAQGLKSMALRLRDVPKPAQMVLRRQAIEDVLAHPERTVAENIHHIRTTLRLTVPEFARLAKVSVRTLRDIEAGRSAGTVQTVEGLLSVVGLGLGIQRRPK